MSAKKAFFKAKAKLSDASPAILVAMGIVGFVGTIVLACHETTKASEIMDEHAKDMDEIKVLQAKKASDDPEYRDDDYTEKDAAKDKFLIATHTGVCMLKCYAPAIVVGSLSIACFLSSYNILRKRYLAASALAASLAEAFNSYRERVRERYGDDVERQLYFGTHEETILQDGKKIKADVMDENGIPVYAKFFDEANRQWNKEPAQNLMFLKGQELHANDMFNQRGYLLLNEVYELLDIPATDIGCEVGWFDTHGDQFVSFGMFDGDDERKRMFVNGYEPSILLSFNCVPKRSGDLAKY